MFDKQYIVEEIKDVKGSVLQSFFNVLIIYICYSYPNQISTFLVAMSAMLITNIILWILYKILIRFSK